MAVHWLGKLLLAATAGFAAGSVPAAEKVTVEIYSAGSLRGVVADLGVEAGSALGIDIKSSFGGSGTMREKIEKGDTPDLFLSADLGSPRKLAALGRTVVPVIAFARNRMCVVSRRAAGINAKNLIDRLLARGVRVRTSTPIDDPSGDYAWAIFDRMEAERPGAGTTLKERARAAMSLTATPATPAQSAAAALFQSNQIDVSITYCSASANLEKELPELTSLVIPPRFDPHPLYGVAVLSSKPEALRLALYLLSEKGQAIIAREGLVPLTDAVPVTAPP